MQKMLIMAIMVFFSEFAVRPARLAACVRSQCFFAHKACYHHFTFEVGSTHDSAKGKETEDIILERKGKENHLLVFL